MNQDPNMQQINLIPTFQTETTRERDTSINNNVAIGLEQMQDNNWPKRGEKCICGMPCRIMGKFVCEFVVSPFMNPFKVNRGSYCVPKQWVSCPAGHVPGFLQEPSSKVPRASPAWSPDLDKNRAKQRKARQNKEKRSKAK